MSINNAIKKIDPSKEYNLSNIIAEDVFPWVKSIKTVRRIVKRDIEGENLLKTRVTGTGRGLVYKIKGKNIIKFLEKYGSGLMMAS